MSYQEKSSIVSLIGTIVISSIYFFEVYNRYQTTGTANVFKFFGIALLLLIPVTIGIKIFATVLLNISHRIMTNEEEPNFSDELDKLIQLKSIRNSYFVFLFGFLLAFASQLIGMSEVHLLVIMAGGLLLHLVAFDVSQILYYRRGV